VTDLIRMSSVRPDMSRRFVLALAAASMLALSAVPSDAIPAFARKYQ